MTQTSTLTAADQEARKGRITSTRIVRLVKGQALAVWNEMQGIAPPPKDNPRMRFGRKLERVIIEAAAEDRAWSPVVYQPGTLVVGDYATSVDALVGSELVVEAKNRGAERAQEYATNEPLEDEIVQTQWHMGVTGIHDAAVCVLLGGNDLRIFDVRHDSELWSGLTEIADRFLRDHVKAGRPPAMDASDAAAEYLRARFPRNTGPLLQADDVTSEWARLLKAQREFLAAHEDQAAELENRLKAAIGEAEGLAGEWGRITWKATKASRKTDWEAVAKALKAPADLIAQHTEEKPGARRFLCTWSKP